MKNNLYINTGDELHNNRETTKNNSSNLLSIMNSKSLTTNESLTAFTSPFNTIGASNRRTKFMQQKPFLKSKSNSKYSALNILTGYNQNNIFLPSIKSNTLKNDLFTNADQIVKDRKRNNIGRILKQTKSTVLGKSKEICLNNFLITQLKEKRNEINNKQIQIYTQLNNSEKRFEIDYKNFIDFVEEINKREKEEEQNLNNFKNISKTIEQNLKEQIIANKNLETKIESIIKQIIILQTYGSFLHKVFYRPFIFDELKKIKLKGKKSISISDKILSLYEESQKNYEENHDIISDVELLMDKYNYFEEKVVNIIKEKEILEEELKEASVYYRNILVQLEERKINCEKENIKLKNEKRAINYMIDESLKFDQNKINEIEKYLEYVNELGDTLNVDVSNNIKNTKTNIILECSAVCEKIIQILGEKENLINVNINAIENIINSGNEKDKEFIEKLIYERKKYNKKEKQLLLINYQKKLEIKKRLKAVEKARRIVIKGRKVFPDIPVFKNKSKKVKEEKTSEYEDFEYLYYSSEKDE